MLSFYRECQCSMVIVRSLCFIVSISNTVSLFINRRGNDAIEGRCDLPFHTVNLLLCLACLSGLSVWPVSAAAKKDISLRCVGTYLLIRDVVKFPDTGTERTFVF